MPKKHSKFKAQIFALIAAFTLFFTPAIASHYTVGGELWASSIGNNKYELTHKIYKYCNSIKPFDSVYIDAYAGNNAACGTVNLKAGIVSSRFIGTKCSTSTDCAAGVPLNEVIYKCTVDLSSQHSPNCLPVHLVKRSHSAPTDIGCGTITRAKTKTHFSQQRST